MRVKPNRAVRLDDGRTACSCAHSVPINCHNRLGETRHPANISMTTYSVCYMSALQAPPRPLAVNEKKSVIFTIEPFWLEPYWRELVLENLTFHYDFNVKAPEHCEGSVVTSDDGQHLCTNSIALNITGGSSNPLHDTKTSVESEILKYDLISGYQPTEDLPAPVETEEEDADVSEEQGGTEFFEENRPQKDKHDVEEAKQKEDNAKKEDEQTSTEEETTTDVADDNEEVEKDDDADSVIEETEKEEAEQKDEDHQENEKDDEKEDEAAEEDESSETEEKANSAAVEKEEKETEDDKEQPEDDVKHQESEEDTENDDAEDDSVEENEEDLAFHERIVKDKGLLARWVFGITIAVCLLFILCVCTCRRRCCRNKDSSKTASGRRYRSVNGQPLVIPPEKEILNQ
ncbi:unnamed protein product [Heligmosomoides polygyrus]|uniref:Uncharacterized protein n=1 Tax=Heligmosomoides polygyrus TaxID=6339 RepID=A0A3P7WN23_HELPZ|nr:unnamed protein product [Heligmosomoides polygyrus]